ncbi:hypothetical protein [Alkalitalea saponilacus]|uniref:Uncharacterized protein n=1 Tax=Alkalitalea saponilacus TaxID=889453 RepID=A0A1T5EZ29_9BACT|nr:hypothetical protein [Alkalitalea saponilacus]ASB47968.1 hypothetical protein CDL62_01770 [Alkalitalea saponilacus]SKB88970.1 hypothetical protein SAMN03080601_01461 [Alkalitalea saponilacus]
MKPIIVSTFLFLILSSCKTQTECLVIKNKTASELSKKQHQYFVDVLRKTYALDNEPQLFNLFLNDLFTAYQKEDIHLLAHIAVDLKQDIERLEEVNMLLKIRDMQHYYYFYPEVITKQRISIVSQDSLSSNKELVASIFPDNYSEAYIGNTPFPHIIIINNDGVQHILSGIQLFEGISFVQDLKQIDSKTTEYMVDYIGHAGGVYFYPLSAFIINNAREEIERPEIRRILSVIFWKLLCLNAGVDF